MITNWIVGLLPKYSRIHLMTLTNFCIWIFLHSLHSNICILFFRASLVTGQNIAVYSDESTNLHLSALPKKEREKIAAEVEKHRGVNIF